MCRTALGKGENENAFSLIRQRQKVHSIHTTLVCVCIAMTPLSRMKTMLKECVPAWIRLLIPLLCSWSRVMGGEKKATGPRRTVDLDWRIKTRSRNTIKCHWVVLWSGHTGPISGHQWVSTFCEVIHWWLFGQFSTLKLLNPSGKKTFVCHVFYSTNWTCLSGEPEGCESGRQALVYHNNNLCICCPCFFFGSSFLRNLVC